MADCERDGCPMEGRIARLEEWQRTSESFHTKIDTWQRDMIASTTRMETQQKDMDGKLDKLLGWQEAQKEKPGRLSAEEAEQIRSDSQSQESPAK